MSGILYWLAGLATVLLITAGLHAAGLPLLLALVLAVIADVLIVRLAARRESHRLGH